MISIVVENNARDRFTAHAGIAIGPILFVVAILAVLVGAIAAGSGGFGSSTAEEAARVRASTIVQQAVNIKSAWDRIIVNGASPTTVIISEAPTTASSTLALYGTAGGGITPQSPPREALPSASGRWLFATGAGSTAALGTIPGIGAAGGDTVVFLEVTLASCKALNELIFGRGSTEAGATPLILTTTAANIDGTGSTTGDAVIPAANAFNMSTGTTFTSGRTAGCGRLDDTTDTYWFYQLLSAG